MSEAETLKILADVFQAMANREKLYAEKEKLNAERDKLESESRKLRFDPYITGMGAAAAFMAAGAAIASLFFHLAK